MARLDGTSQDLDERRGSVLVELARESWDRGSIRDKVLDPFSPERHKLTGEAVFNESGEAESLQVDRKAPDLGFRSETFKKTPRPDGQEGWLLTYSSGVGMALDFEKLTVDGQGNLVSLHPRSVLAGGLYGEECTDFTQDSLVGRVHEDGIANPHGNLSGRTRPSA